MGRSGIKTDTRLKLMQYREFAEQCIKSLERFGIR